jgi:signal transduction histidine kinase
MKVQSQVALRAGDENEREKALRGVVAGVDRASHLIDQLLALSRLDLQPRSGPRAAVDLTAVATRVAADLNEYASRRSIQICGHGDADSAIFADEALVSTLVRNLLDNAIRYCDGGDRIRWSVTRAPGSVRLKIADTGPGIPEAERHAVFERFHRLPGSRGSGVGLGLSIVRKIAELYDAKVAILDPESGPGLCVSVAFPMTETADQGRGSGAE